MDYQSASVIHQIILSVDGKLLLESTSDCDRLWDLESNQPVKENPTNKTRHSWHWMSHPRDTSLLLLVCDNNVETFRWTSLEQACDPQELVAGKTINRALSASYLGPSVQTGTICALFVNQQESGPPSELCIYSSSSFSSQAELIVPAACYNDLAKTIRSEIGCLASQFIFLDHNGWVCSLNIGSLGQKGSFSKHFFIPPQWQSITGNVPVLVTRRGSVVMASENEIAVFHNGL